MAEYDNAGFPFSYCLLSTTEATTPGKRIDPLERWATHVNKYQLHPQFVNVDKNLAEIVMAKRVWPNGQIQICGWHMKKAVRERITKAKLSTTLYRAIEACKQFPFIDLKFVPPSQADPGEKEGGREGGRWDTTLDEPKSELVKCDLNALYIHLPPTQKPVETGESVPLTQQTQEATTSFKIKLPPLKASQALQPITPQEVKQVFCPEEHVKTLLAMVLEHRNAHPLLPGKLASTAEGIHSWAVKKMYQFCEGEDLRELWAYLWENWYRPERWKLWARAIVPEIPRLNTTMVLESHWRHIKHDFLHHFSKPRIDLLAWIVVTKLGPLYHQKLDVHFGDIGRYQSPSAWQKPFKKAWRECEKRTIPEPTGVFGYRTDVRKWVCTCPALASSRFLICKHLVQGVKPVPPKFFLQVTRNHTAPIWSHPFLVPLDDMDPPQLLVSKTTIHKPNSKATDTETLEIHDGDDEGDTTDNEDNYWAEVEQRFMSVQMGKK
ncbi:hypothetical protein PM082_022723 [Marasmius tenuissimus]|nr:hypothetical protein PM082_022723 [Marasmius tenuissimus]